MKIATSLILKVSGGMAVVGGAGGVYILHKSGYFSWGSKADKKNDTTQKPLGSQNDTFQNNALDQQGKDEVVNGKNLSEKKTELNEQKKQEEEEVVLQGEEEADEIDTNAVPEAVPEKEDTLDPEIEKKVKGGQKLTDEEKNKRIEFLKKKRESEMKKQFEDMFKPFLLEDNLGLPEKCDSVVKEKKHTSCSLSSEDLKKIKFKWLGEEGEVKVTPNASVDLKLVGLLGYGGGRKAGLKYLFSNGSNKDIVIRRGDKSVTLKAKTKKGYIVENGKLRREILGKYGLPKRCEAKGNFAFDIFSLDPDKKVCNLYEDDLSRIKFSGLGESEDPVSFNWKDNDFDRQSMILTIEDDKYVFCGHKKITTDSNTKEKTTDINSLTLSKGNSSLELKGEFNPEGDKLKKKTP